MMSKIIQILGVIALGGLLLASGAVTKTVSVDAQGVTVTISAPAEAVKDSDFTVSVDITNVTDFDAGQCDVSFDDSVLRLDDVTAGLIGGTQIPVALWNKISPGTYRIIVNVPGVPGVSGSGYLAALCFHAIGSAGSSTVNLSNGFLNNNLGEEITATWSGGSLTVYEEVAKPTYPVPELPSAALLGTGVVCLGGYLLLQRRKGHKA